MVHRYDVAQKHIRNQHAPQKKKLFEKFMHLHQGAYVDVRAPFQVHPRAPNSAAAADTRQQHVDAMKHQSLIQEAHKEILQNDVDCSGDAVMSALLSSRDCMASVEALAASERPISPIEYAVQLIAQSGVWKIEEAYLSALFLIQPLQQAWGQARREGASDGPQKLLELMRAAPPRQLFTHGPGGSGKTYCQTEVVLKVMQRFLGYHGVQAMAAQNSTARLLAKSGVPAQTIHAAGKMNRGQALTAKGLKPNSRKRQQLRKEWLGRGYMLGDEWSMTAPSLHAGVSRRAFHGRCQNLRLDVTAVLEHPFGDIPIQHLMADFLQLNPVRTHALLEAFATTPVPGVPKRTEDEDRDGYALFRHACKNVVLFKGRQRFLDDDLPELLQIMETPGGRRVPDILKEKIIARIQAGAHPIIPIGSH